MKAVFKDFNLKLDKEQKKKSLSRRQPKDDDCRDNFQNKKTPKWKLENPKVDKKKKKEGKNIIGANGIIKIKVNGCCIIHQSVRIPQKIIKILTTIRSKTKQWQLCKKKMSPLQMYWSVPKKQKNDKVCSVHNG